MQEPVVMGAAAPPLATLVVVEIDCVKDLLHRLGGGLCNKTYVLHIGRVLVATVPSAPNPPADQCAIVKGDFSVYFPEYAKVPLPFI